MRLLKNIQICLLAACVAFALGCGEDDHDGHDHGAGGAGAAGGAGGAGAEGGAGGAGGAGAEGGAGGAGAEGGAGGAGAEGGAGGAGAEGGAGGAGGDGGAGGEPGPTMNIREIAEADGRFTTVLALVEQAGLTALLEGFDEYTVFAPTDDAFAALDPAVTEAVMNDPQLLAGVLALHVVAGKANAESVVAGTLVETLGGYVSVAVEGEAVAVGGAPVSATDIMATNGVIHVIDNVITSNASIVEIATGLPDFSTLVELLVAADLVGALTADGAEFTVFAPTNDAFAALDAATLEAVMNDSDLLTSVLLHHVIGDAVVMAADVAAGEVETLGGTVTIEGDADAGFTINGAPIAVTDIKAGNGVIHIMGGVIVPAPAE